MAGLLLDQYVLESLMEERSAPGVPFVEMLDVAAESGRGSGACPVESELSAVQLGAEAGFGPASDTLPFTFLAWAEVA